MNAVDLPVCEFKDAASSPAACAVPFISVLVPVRNEAAAIGSTLRQLLNQDYPVDRFEILVADGRSTDSTRQIVADLLRQHPSLKLLDNPKRWSSAGRNVALRESVGDIVLVIDGHCEIDQRRLSDGACIRVSTEWSGLYRQTAAARYCLWRLRCSVPSPSARASRLGHHPDSHIYSDRESFVRPDSVAMAYRREVFERIGSFDEAFDACEDVELNYRVAQARMTCFFTPRLAVRYQPRGTSAGLFHQMARYGRGRARLVAQASGDILSQNSSAGGLRRRFGRRADARASVGRCSGSPTVES